MIGIIIFLIVIGFVLYLLRGRLDPTIYTIIMALLVLGVALWLLSLFGLVTIPSGLQFKTK